MCAVRKSRSLLLLPSTHPYSWIIKKNIDPISSFQPSRHTYDHQRIHIYFLLHLANNLNFSEVEWIAWQKKNVYAWIDKEEDDDEVQCAPFKRPHTSIAGLDARKRSESVFWPPCVVGARFIFFNVCYFRACTLFTLRSYSSWERDDVYMYVCLFGCWTDQINFLCIYTRAPCVRRGASVHCECLIRPVRVGTV